MKTVVQTLILFCILAIAHTATAQARLLPDRLILQDPHKVFISASQGRMFLRADDFLLLLKNTEITSRIYISNTGRVVIGRDHLSHPSKLHIIQQFNDNALTIENNVGDYWTFHMDNPELQFKFNDVIKGEWRSTDGSYVLTSDRRLKDNINLMQDGVLTKLMQLKPSTYYYKDDQKRSEHSYGFIAQEVQEVFPEVVVAPEREDEPYMINYTKIGVLAVKAIQELNTKLEAENQALRTELQELRSLVEQLAVSFSQNIGTATAKTKDASSARLEQNVPNPFYTTTRIDYFIPSTVQKASLIITNIEGRLVKSMAIENHGIGSIELDTSQLSQGTYFYSLQLDGKLVATKQMIAFW